MIPKEIYYKIQSIFIILECLLQNCIFIIILHFYHFEFCKVCNIYIFESNMHYKNGFNEHYKALFLNFRPSSNNSYEH